MDNYPSVVHLVYGYYCVLPLGSGGASNNLFALSEWMALDMQYPNQPNF